MLTHFARSLTHSAHDLFFRTVHNRSLIYNTCWEDPRIDRELMGIDTDSEIVVITSAGCNALDYLLDVPKSIHCVDINPRQNALLELKAALIRNANHEQLYALFGKGSHPEFKDIYESVASMLAPYARQFWDNKISYFSHTNKKQSFYYHGTSGMVAWAITRFLFRPKTNIKRYVQELLHSNNIEQQRNIYALIEPALWSPLLTWLMKQPILLSLLGVPRSQIRLIKESEGIASYISRRLRHVLSEVLITDNYFWRVYLTGAYTQKCCPNYLKEENFNLLRAHIHKIDIHNTTISRFLQKNPGNYTHFILLDHQDWLAWHNPRALAEEWALIFRNSAPGAKILMRSASPHVQFLPQQVLASLQFYPELTESLHLTDRVGTYGSLHFAQVI